MKETWCILLLQDLNKIMRLFCKKGNFRFNRYRDGHDFDFKIKIMILKSKS